MQYSLHFRMARSPINLVVSETVHKNATTRFVVVQIPLGPTTLVCLSRERTLSGHMLFILRWLVMLVQSEPQSLQLLASRYRY